MKKKLLLLHGALGSTAQWPALKEKLMPHVDLYDFNFSGHGSNTTISDYSIDLFEGDTLTFLDDQNLEQVNIFGYSMGGYVALSLAKKHPGRLHKIITLATKFDWSPETAAKEVKMLDPDVIEEKIPYFAQNLQQRHSPANWKSIVRKTAIMMSDLGNGMAMKHEDFQSIRHEVLICIGNEDKMVSIEESNIVANNLKNGILKIIPGFKHPIETNDVSVLADLISGFLDGKTND